MHVMHSVLVHGGRFFVFAGVVSILSSSVFGLWNLIEDATDAFRK